MGRAVGRHEKIDERRQGRSIRSLRSKVAVLDIILSPPLICVGQECGNLAAKVRHSMFPKSDYWKRKADCWNNSPAIVFTPQRAQRGSNAQPTDSKFGTLSVKLYSLVGKHTASKQSARCLP